MPTVAEKAGIANVELESWERLVERLYGTLAGKFASDALKEMRAEAGPSFESR